jgi:hypothetical protein
MLTQYTGSFRSVVLTLVAATLVVLAPTAEAGRRKTSNAAPVISGTPVTTVVVNTAYSFTPTATDANGDRLTFAIRNKPSWAVFSSVTGALTGTPTIIGSYPNVEIRVSDGKVSTALPRFSITVTSAPSTTPPPTTTTNHPPVISGTAVTTGQADQPYAFQPTATDADGDTLTYTIQNKPSWATFDAAYGTLYGTPTAANVGTYSNVVIGVSDGKSSATLPAFTITVNPAPTRSVTLGWTAPAANTDGSALTDLAGYKVFYGSAPGQYSASVTVPGSSINSAVMSGLAAGTWYFSIKSVNSAGVESDFSGEVSAVL